MTDNPDATRTQVTAMEALALHHERKALRIRAEIQENANRVAALTSFEVKIAAQIGEVIGGFVREGDLPDNWPGTQPIAEAIVRRVLRGAE